MALAGGLVAAESKSVSANDDLASEAELYNGAEYAGAFKNPKDNSNRPNVLFNGDSISNAYTVDVRKQLRGKADVFRIPGNGKDSAYGLENLDAWLANGSGRSSILIGACGICVTGTRR